MEELCLWLEFGIRKSLIPWEIMQKKKKKNCQWWMQCEYSRQSWYATILYKATAKMMQGNKAEWKSLVQKMQKGNLQF